MNKTINDNIIDENLKKILIQEKQDNENKIMLKQILDSSRSNKNHKEEIDELSTLKEVHIYCKVNNLSGQFTGPAIENYIKNKHNMTKNNPSSCNGDLKYNETNVEIKASNGGKENNKFNFVQHIMLITVT